MPPNTAWHREYRATAIGPHLRSLPLPDAQGSLQRRQTAPGRHLRAGDERLGELLVLGATSVLCHVVRGKPAHGASAWLMKLLERKPRKLVAVALARWPGSSGL